MAAGSVSTEYHAPGELCPPEPAPATLAPPMRVFSLARSFFGGQKRPCDGDFRQLILAFKEQSTEETGSILHALWGLAYRSGDGAAAILANHMVQSACERLRCAEVADVNESNALWVPAMGLLSALSKYEELVSLIVQSGALDMLEQDFAVGVLSTGGDATLEETVVLVHNLIRDPNVRMLFGTKSRMCILVRIAELVVEQYEPASSTFAQTMTMIWLVINASFDFKTGFVQAGGVTAMRSAIRKCKNLHVPAMDLVIGVIGSLCVREDIAELVAAEGITSDVVLTLKTHTKSPSVLCASCFVIALLAPYVQARHGHIADIAVRTLQQNMTNAETVEAGCNVLWRITSLGSDKAVIQSGAKQLLEMVFSSSISPLCPSAHAVSRCLYNLGHVRELTPPSPPPPAIDLPGDQEVQDDPKAALEKIKKLVGVETHDKVAAHAVVLQILGHSEIDEESVEAAWKLVTQIDAFGTHAVMGQLLGDKPLSSSTESWNSCQTECLEDLYCDSDSEDQEEAVSPSPSLSPAKGEPPFRIGLPINMMWSSPKHIRDMKDEKKVEPCFQRPPELKRDVYMMLANRRGGKSKIVYDLRNSKWDKNKSRSKKPGLKKKLAPLQTLSGPEDTTILFESRFECGNLMCAIKTAEFEYDLILRPDYRTEGHTQWYYFRMSNITANKKYRFSIVNYAKSDSLYNSGLKPLIYSEKKAKTGTGWYRGGDEILYFTNYMSRGPLNPHKYKTLHFTVEFEHDKDTVYLAHAFPYRFTDMQAHIDTLCRDPVRSQYVQRTLLCKSLAGNSCELLTVSEGPDEGKTAIVTSARVHPGESCASFMMEGFIDFLTGPSPEAEQLRKMFVFKIVPMLNPDGVIVGNSRCSLAGVDLNRRYRKPSKRLIPTIFHLKELIYELQLERGVFAFLDMHGHSRKMSIFMYGCKEQSRIPERSQPSPSQTRSNEVAGNWARALPYIFSQQYPLFSYEDSSFCVHRSKAATGRVVVWQELGVSNSFTLEASFCGAREGRNGPWHFHTGHLHKTGQKLCKTLLVCSKDEEMIKALAEIRFAWVDGIQKDGWRSSFAEQTITSYEYDSSGDDSGRSDGGGSEEDQMEAEQVVGVASDSEMETAVLQHRMRVQKKQSEKQTAKAASASRALTATTRERVTRPPVPSRRQDSERQRLRGPKSPSCSTSPSARSRAAEKFVSSIDLYTDCYEAPPPNQRRNNFCSSSLRRDIADVKAGLATNSSASRPAPIFNFSSTVFPPVRQKPRPRHHVQSLGEAANATPITSGDGRRKPSRDSNLSNVDIAATWSASRTLSPVSSWMTRPSSQLENGDDQLESLANSSPSMHHGISKRPLQKAADRQSVVQSPAARQRSVLSVDLYASVRNNREQVSQSNRDQTNRVSNDPMAPSRNGSASALRNGGAVARGHLDRWVSRKKF